MVVLAFVLAFVLVGWRQSVFASSGEGVFEPNGRGLQLLGGREAILLDQTERARRAARARALTLYRLLRVVAVERNAAAGPGTEVRIGARSVALATAVLARDLAEARSLRAELDRVRGERTALATPPATSSFMPATNAGSFAGHPISPATGPAATDTCGPVRCDATPAPLRGPAPAFMRPASGALVTPFGVGRDSATGAWIFRAAATFAVRRGEIVRSPAAGQVARVASSVAGGVAVVLTIPGGAPPSPPMPSKALGAPPPRSGQTERSDSSPLAAGWTVVVSGLASVAVAPGEAVGRGDPIGTAPSHGAATVRIETWRGRSPVDPAAVLRAIR